MQHEYRDKAVNGVIRKNCICSAGKLNKISDFVGRTLLNVSQSIDEIPSRLVYIFEKPQHVERNVKYNRTHRLPRLARFNIVFRSQSLVEVIQSVIMDAISGRSASRLNTIYQYKYKSKLASFFIKRLSNNLGILFK